MFSLSRDQKQVLKDLLEWWRKDRTGMQFVTMGGYAGTGKTTLIAVFRRELARTAPKTRVGFASYTGKAARVLATSLKQEHAIRKGDTVGTIHSLIYSPVVNERQEIVGWKQKDRIDPDLVVIDEASMVDGEIWQHLISYRIPLVVVGDHGQLPPIRGNFNLIAKPNLLLQEIHRQAAENPIIRLSIDAREKGEIAPGEYGKGVRKFSADDPDVRERMEELLTAYTPETLVLCGYNTTRRRLNGFIRNALGYYSPEPVVGDRVICLRNNHKARIYNGMLGTVADIRKKNDDWYGTEILMDGDEAPYAGLISVRQFNNADGPLNFTGRRRDTLAGDLFDFGYALTVHKAQGSQAKRVILFEERFSKMTDDEWRRWLYTAVTRAEEELYIFPGR